MSYPFAQLSTVRVTQPSVSTSKGAMSPTPSPLERPVMHTRNSSKASSRRSLSSVSSTTSSIWKRSVSFVSERSNDEYSEGRAQRKKRESEAYNIRNPQFWNAVFRA